MIQQNKRHLVHMMGWIYFGRVTGKKLGKQKGQALISWYIGTYNFNEMYSMQDALTSFFSLKPTCQPDKNSSICIQLYLSAHKSLENRKKKIKTWWIRLPFSLQNSTELHPDHRHSSLCSQCSSILRVSVPWLTGETDVLSGCMKWKTKAVPGS